VPFEDTHCVHFGIKQVHFGFIRHIEPGGIELTIWPCEPSDIVTVIWCVRPGLGESFAAGAVVLSLTVCDVARRGLSGPNGPSLEESAATARPCGVPALPAP